MSWINTSLSALGSIGSTVGGWIQPMAELAQFTAPLWESVAPKMAPIVGGYTPAGSAPAQQQPSRPPEAVPGTWVPISEGEEVYQVAYQPTSTYGGFQTAGFDLPGIDLMVPESQRIQPIAGGASVRMPSSVTVPYKGTTGRQLYAHYKNMGRPVLYSGDFAAARRVKRVASKARRRSGGR